MRLNEGHLYLALAIVTTVAAGVMWLTGFEHDIATAMLVATAAVGVLRWQGYASDQARRRETQALRAELARYAKTVEDLLEATKARHEQDVEHTADRAFSLGMTVGEAEGGRTAVGQRVVRQVPAPRRHP